MNYGKVIFYILVLTITVEFYSGYTSRLSRFFKRPNKQQKRYGTSSGIGGKSYWHNVKNISKKDFAIAVGGGATVYSINEIRKYFKEKELQEQTWWGNIKDWWELRNLSKEEQDAVKEIITVL